MKRLILVSLLSACSVDDGTTPTCIASMTDTCTGDTVCIGTTCQAAFPHAYAITNLSITAPNLRMDGMPWDPEDDGAPDLYAEISVGGALVATTDVNQNTYNATFAGPFTVMLDTNVAIDVTASDKDDAASELVYDCSVPMVSPLLLRVRHVLCSGTGVTMNYTIDPIE
ncbi:MAG: hypothetical protein ABI678_08670 [Kofleriaceae bacterium]